MISLKKCARQFKLGLCVLAIIPMVIAGILPPVTVDAANANEFRAGRIIDDEVFYNPAGMTVGQIQAFLDAKVPTCDTNGTSNSSHWYGAAGRYYTRAEWGTLNGFPPPYTCLKNYTENIPGKGTDTYCGRGVPAGIRTAAQIIADVATACSVSPRVMLVLLQKEQGLVTDAWPWQKQYNAATGFACPDTAACDSTYRGYFNQVYYGARQYQRYAKEPQNYNFKAARQSNVRYNPNAACGSSPVYILNQSTAGLYNYTPYQPNQAALNNLYGTGDACSAYGNRNFWRMFSDWFGATYANCVMPAGEDGEVYRIAQLGSNNYMLTADPYEVCAATANYGFTYDAVVSKSVSGASPVFRLVRAGKYLYTTSTAERDAATANYGFSYEGAAFEASTTPTANAPLAMYRLSNPTSGTYLYTVSNGERDQAIASGFAYEGVAFYVKGATNSTAGIYRLSSASGGYLYTSSDAERDAASLGYGFRVEGVAFSAYTGFSNNSVPIYRLAGARGYLYTTSLTERKAAMALGYRAEGITFYAADNITARNPVFRLANPSGVYLYTTSTAERDAAVAQFGYRLEGVVFYLP